MEVIGYTILVLSAGAIFYGFYRIFKYMLNGIRSCDD